MNNNADIERLKFLMRVVEKELDHLKYSQHKVFAQTFTRERAETLAHAPVLAEQVEAFSSRFCRFQDTFGDKLLPVWLKLLSEPLGAVVDNMDRAEKLGILPSADDWLETRQLRNQMVHEYIEDMEILAQALQTANQKIDLFVDVTDRLFTDIAKRGWF